VELKEGYGLRSCSYALAIPCINDEEQAECHVLTFTFDKNKNRNLIQCYMRTLRALAWLAWRRVCAPIADGHLPLWARLLPLLT
jgi:hypothetical protein